MPNRVDIANSLSRQLGIPIWEAQELIRRMPAVLVVGNLEEFQRVSRYPSVTTSQTQGAVAGEYSEFSLAPLAGQVCKVSAISLRSSVGAIAQLRLGAPLVGGTAYATLFADRRISGTPAVDWRSDTNVAQSGTNIFDQYTNANTTYILERELWLTNAQGLIISVSTVNVALLASVVFEIFGDAVL